MLSIENLQASVDEKAILKGLNLSVGAGEVHAIMGPNGAGKSTLSNVMGGRPGYEATGGSVTLDGVDLLELEPEERAYAGLFLAFQYPVELPGVSNMEFLKAAVEANCENRGVEAPNTPAFLKAAREACAQVNLNPDFLKRGVNEGFSGGERKRNEILQMIMLQPKLCVLDETDSGLDIDALQVVADGVNSLRSDDRGFVVITHYQRLLDYIVPDFVHVLSDGKIIKQLTSASDLAVARELAADILALEAPTVTLVDGQYCAELSRLPSGLNATSFSEATAEQHASLAQSLGTQARADGQAFVLLNEALNQDGVLVEVGSGESPAESLHILNLRTAAGTAAPRVWVSVGENAQLTIAEHHLCAEGVASFDLPVSELHIGANSTVHHYRFALSQSGGRHIGRVATRQERDSRYYAYLAVLGGDFNRLDFGYGRRAGQSGVQRPHPHPPGCAENQRGAVQPQPVAVANGGNQHQA